MKDKIKGAFLSVGGFCKTHAEKIVILIAMGLVCVPFILIFVFFNKGVSDASDITELTEETTVLQTTAYEPETEETTEYVMSFTDVDETCYATEEIYALEEPYINASVLYTIQKNTEIHVIGENGMWYKVLYEGVVCYITRNSLTKEIETTTTRPAKNLEEFTTTVLSAEEFERLYGTEEEKAEDVVEEIQTTEPVTTTCHETFDSIECELGYGTSYSRAVEVKSGTTVTLTFDATAYASATDKTSACGYVLFYALERFMGYHYVEDATTTVTTTEADANTASETTENLTDSETTNSETTVTETDTETATDNVYLRKYNDAYTALISTNGYREIFREYGYNYGVCGSFANNADTSSSLSTYGITYVSTGLTSESAFVSAMKAGTEGTLTLTLDGTTLVVRLQVGDVISTMRYTGVNTATNGGLYVALTGSLVSVTNIESLRVQYVEEINQVTVGIDVSKWQGKIDWVKAVNDGIDFTIIQAARREADSGIISVEETFKYNINGALANGLDVGVYFFSQAITVEEAIEEADFIVALLNENGYSPSDLKYGISIDWEMRSNQQTTAFRAYRAFKTWKSNGTLKSIMTAIIDAFCERIQEYGYSTMVYANANYFKNYMDYSYLQSKYKIWYAGFTYNETSLAYTDYENVINDILTNNVKPNPLATYGINLNYYIWQCGSTFYVDGIPNRVDLDIIYNQ